MQETQLSKRTHSASSASLWSLPMVTCHLPHALPIGETVQAAAIPKSDFFLPCLLAFSVIETLDSPRFERERERERQILFIIFVAL